MTDIEKVTGKEMEIIFEAKKCIHSRNCVLTRPDVFVPNVEGEWIYPDRATPEEIAELAHNCPSGAISYRSLAGDLNETPPLVNTVRVRENGPLAFSADLKIDEYEPSLRATLCRCGHSKNKPFCDGAHATQNFIATGEVALSEFKALEIRNGDLKITPIKNGPYQVSGPLEIVTGTGKTVNKTKKTFLCRCGQSKNKPYCDGTHNQINFQT